MQKLLFIFLSAFFLAPAVGFAAFDDVTLTADAIINVAGINLNVSGSSAVVESITVNASNFSFILQSGSSIQVTSPDRRILSTDAPSQYIITNTCGSSESVLKHSSSVAGSVTIIVTPESSTCTIAANSGASGGGAISLAFIAPTTQSKSTAQTATGKSSVSALFTKTLKRGMLDADVKRLQILLNTDHETRIAEAGPGSPGQETEYFGGATERAVQRFQKKHDIVSSGDPNTTGYGLIGALTRRMFQTVFENGSAPAVRVAKPVSQAVSVSPIFNSSLKRGMSHTDVKRLQILLNRIRETRIAEAGAGSPGNETDYFGAATQKAVGKFQELYGLASPQDSAYGYVGPMTRAKLKELFRK
jgi:peptidoglycan hydrolase-like protein with peptidoglycan-binding domain